MAGVVRSSLFPLRSMRLLERRLGWTRQNLKRLATTADRQYHPFTQTKPNGKQREIDNPSAAIKSLQKRINRRILGTVPLPPSILGAVPGRSIRDNGELHAGTPVVATVDLQRFFPSTRFERVFGVYKEIFGCSDEIAKLLTRLTTYRHRLPQGAPTSATLANLTLLPLHDHVQRIAARHEVEASFWLDDITLSGANAEAALVDVEAAIQKHGHRVSPGKTRVMRSWETAQEVTGTVTNRKVSRGRREIESIRAAILDLSAGAKPSDKELRRLRGRIQHVRHLCPSHGHSLLKLAARCIPDEFAREPK